MRVGTASEFSCQASASPPTCARRGLIVGTLRIICDGLCSVWGDCTTLETMEGAGRAAPAEADCIRHYDAHPRLLQYFISFRPEAEACLHHDGLLHDHVVFEHVAKAHMDVHVVPQERFQQRTVELIPVPQDIWKILHVDHFSHQERSSERIEEQNVDDEPAPVVE